MRQLATVCAVVTALFYAQNTALAQENWYVAGSIGGYFRTSNSGASIFSNNEGEAPGTSTTTFNPGITADLALGYKLPRGFRIEGEIGAAYYTTNSTSPLSANTTLFPYLNGTKLGIQSGGDHERYIETVNLFYDLPISGRFVPYLGGGFGAVEDGGATAYFTEYGGARTFRENAASGIHPAVLGEVGLDVKVTRAWSIVPAYRYMHAFASGDAAEESANIIKIGARYAF